MTSSPHSISITEGAKMLGMSEAELRQHLENRQRQPGDRRCIQAAFHLLQDEAVWKALQEAQTKPPEEHP